MAIATVAVVLVNTGGSPPASEAAAATVVVPRPALAEPVVESPLALEASLRAERVPEPLSAQLLSDETADENATAQTWAPVTVFVVDPEGRPCDELVVVEATLATDRDAADSGSTADSATGYRTLQLEALELGVGYDLWVRRERGRRHGPLAFQLPGQAGGTSIEVTLGPALFELVVSLVDRSGSPLSAGVELTEGVRTSMGAAVRSGFGLDGGATRRLRFDPRADLSGSEFLFHGIQWSADDGETMWSFQPAQPLGEGLHHLGELSPLPRELLAAGRVVDPYGEPVPGAAVHFECEGQDLLRGVRGRREITIARADAEGDFEIESTRLPGKLTVWADHGTRLSRPIVLGSASDRALALELLPSGLVHSDRPTAGRTATLCAISHSAAGREQPAIEVDFNSEGWTGRLPVGIYDLLWLDRRGRTLTTSEGVLVEADAGSL